ncbi:unnamed protein product [Prunus brigantina]
MPSSVKLLHPGGRLERMYMGKRILCASVEGDAEGLDFLLLVVRHLWVLEINGNMNGSPLTAQDTIPAIPVDLCWFIRPIPWWGDAEGP